MTKRSRETTPDFFGILLASCYEPTEEFYFYYIEYDKLTDEQRKELNGSCPSTREDAKIPGCFDLEDNQEEFHGWQSCKQKDMAKLTAEAHVSFAVGLL